MNLYEITHSIDTLMYDAEIYAEENEGVIPDDLAAQMDALQLQYSDKVDHCGMYAKNQMALIDALKKEEDALRLRRKSAENRVEWMKKYMLANVIDKYESAKVKISFRNTPSVFIHDESAVDNRFFVEKIERNISKTMIKEAIQSGEDVAGCSIVTNKSITIK